MSSKKDQIAKLLEAKELVNYLPNMKPDILDDFITYLYERVDIPRFAQSHITYKMQMYKKFMRQLPYERLQYQIVFK